MPSGTVPINISKDFVFIDGNTDLQLVDSGIGGPWTHVSLSIVVSDLSGQSVNYALFEEDNGQNPGVNVNCFVTPSFGVLYDFECDRSAAQPTSVQLWFYPRGAGSFPRTLRVNATGSFTFTASGDCAYGTRPKAGVTFLYWLTPGILDVWFGAAGLAVLAPFFTAFWFTYIDLTGVCGSGPGPIPVLDQNIANWSRDQQLQFIRAVAWFSLCECVPGSPPPITFPPPVLPPSVAIPTPLTFPCSDGDPCAAIIQLQRSVAAIQQSVTSTNELVTLLQRYRLPFAYILGSSHLNLTGSGSIVLPSRLIGLMLTIDATPVGTLTLPGTPVYNENLGWVSVLDTNGFIDEKRLTRTPHIWMPPLMPDVVKFGYNLNPGVTLRVTELQAEP